ncbi:hypothetical protein SERLA73DRAFT_68102 [Serpula lacrymans var. lacrymans S7.3]|uniref:Uncharacterized protein n=2 Tax=Serpula lacrymans var. lacrymans TaxID=341189 RepID=F8PGY1_SERL3|nr:uncharacterized protein SERLADRAFT_431829 [Serpula lacrymans var. lacrymans S7.9]EGO04418.1 hypothetical protein SERLA73DRAFT_68102 [Serpula lacrymans var. lacrymans S7.3]EGO30318.1 hypothetical protein SERLADRAFT_431829 [Serpula lacrymans var. lacrymans S7.9]
MAKPHYVPHLKPPSPSPHRLPRPQAPLRRSPTRPPHVPIIAPSSCLLSILATIATAPPAVGGSPLPIQTHPPGFLCPFIERDTVGLPDDQPSVALSSDSGITYSEPTPTRKPTKLAREIADKYVQGTDTRWRKTDKWTLYGSTYCSTSTTTSVANTDGDFALPTPPPSSTTADVLSSNYTSTIVISTSSTATDFLDTSVLPAGWKEDSSSTKSNTPLILALSLVLALSICGFMVGCILWRKKKRHLRAVNDLELKIRKKLRPDDTSEDDQFDKDVLGKQRLWVKASARWKANIRHSARRRRSRRPAFSGMKSPRSRSSSFSLTDPPDVSLGVLPPPAPSSSLSRRQSLASLLSQENHISSTSQISEDSDTFDSIKATTVSQSPSSDIPAFPPAYNTSTTYNTPSVPSDVDSYATSSLDLAHFSAARVNALRRSSVHLSQSDPSSEDYISYEAGDFAAHVATDDKTQLARLVDMASAPPIMDEPGGSSHVHISAPAWHYEPDVFPDDFPPNCSRPSLSHVHMPYPMPPSKRNSTAKYFDGYPYAFEDDIASLEVEPSAPPFEAHPSAPPIGLAASAPPLEVFGQPHGSCINVPDLDWPLEGSEYESSTVSVDVLSDEGLLPSHNRLGSRHPSFTETGMLPVQGPAARDGTLPTYCP